MKNSLTVIAIAAACMLAPGALARNSGDQNRTPDASAQKPDNTQGNEKVLAAKGGGLLNSDATPEQAKKIAEATNRQILEKQRKR
jgi:hypothetical protein